MHFKDDGNYYNEYKEAMDKLNKIKEWTEAYPVDVFKKPDFEKVSKILAYNGISIDSVSACIIRRVLDGLKEIINEK